GVRASHAGARARPSVFPIRYNAAHHAGAPALAMVTIYHSPTLYRLTTRIGYGPDYAARYTLIADVIRAPGDVLELCCGDLALHRLARPCSHADGRRPRSRLPLHGGDSAGAVRPLQDPGESTRPDAEPVRAGRLVSQSSFCDGRRRSQETIRDR